MEGAFVREFGYFNQSQISESLHVHRISLSALEMYCDHFIESFQLSVKEFRDVLIPI